MVQSLARKTLILGTAGHIDHGKTSLVRALTGVDTDRLPEEKSRGITIDIGFANLDLGEYRLGIVDVPGHERFIKNMLAGASGIDIALLVVAADDGIMPQTREHLAILELLRIRQGVIALTKCDLSDSDWIDLVEEDLRDLTRGTFLEDALVVRTSAATRTGIDDLHAALEQTARRIEQPHASAVFRLAIDRSFVGQGVGTIVTGTVNSGTLCVGDSIAWMPSGKEVRVRAIQSHGRDVESVSRGQRAAINLIGAHHTEIVRGHELATPGSFKASRRLTVRVRVLRDSPWPIRHRARLRLHVGTAEIMCRVRLLEGTEIAPGETALAQLILAQPAATVADQPFVLRAESPLVTLGGGNVVQPIGTRIRRRDDSVMNRLRDLESPEPPKRASAAISFFGLGTWTELDLQRDARVPCEQAPEILAALIGQQEIIELTDTAGRAQRVHSQAIAAVEDRVRRALKRLHDEFSLDTAIMRQRVVQALRHLGDESLVSGVIRRMLTEHRLVGDEQAVALPDFKPRVSAAQRELLSKVEAMYDEARFSPPDLREMARTLGKAEKEMRPILDLGVEVGCLVHLGGPLYMHRDRERELRETVSHALRDTSGLAVSEFRDLLNTSRKYAIPICEYLDRAGVTKRVGDMRVAGMAAEVRK